MEQRAVGTSPRTVVAVVADDLIWASRLRAAVENAGAHPVTARSAPAIDAPYAVVDLNGRGYDGITAVRDAAEAGATVLAVGQHEDVELRKAALAAGARRVLSYNKLFNDGPTVITRLIEGNL
jgi:hypothetical protein